MTIVTTATIVIAPSQIHTFVSIPTRDLSKEPQTDVPPTGASAHQPPVTTGASRTETTTAAVTPTQIAAATDRLRFGMMQTYQFTCSARAIETNP